jgi:hypothetical protein
MSAFSTEPYLTGLWAISSMTHAGRWEWSEIIIEGLRQTKGPRPPHAESLWQAWHALAVGLASCC